MPVSPFMGHFEASLSGGSPWGSPLSSDDFASFAEMHKSLEAGYGTDVAGLSGGGALRIESLESVLMSVVQTNEDFPLFNKMKKGEAGATVDQWVEKTDIGGFPGSGFNAETGTITERTASYARRVANVKYLQTKRSISAVLKAQQAILDAESDEQVNGVLELLTSVEWGMIYGDADVVPEEFNGLRHEIDAHGTSDQVKDNRGLALDPQFVSYLAGVTRSRGHFGRLTDAYVSVNVQTDLNNYLDPAYRVALSGNPQNVTLGAPVTKFNTSFGVLDVTSDVFLEEGGQPFEVLYPSLVSGGPSAPVSVTAAVTTDTASRFETPHAGVYYYRVESCSRAGRSATVVSGAATVAAGDKVTLTITRPANLSATGYAVYRSRKGESDTAAANFRLMGRVADSGSSTTTYVDRNTEIPGTSMVLLVSHAPEKNAIAWRQLMPLTRFQLFPTDSAINPWAQLLFGYLRVSKARQHAYIKNVLPSNALWKPFEI